MIATGLAAGIDAFVRNGVGTSTSARGAAASGFSGNADSRPILARADDVVVVAGAGDVVFSGRATLDGVPVTTRWIGAVVVRDGLVTPCQVTLPSITAGHYEIPVYGRTAAAGCGQPGSHVVFWIYASDQFVYSTAPVPWPDAPSADADLAFSSAQPAGSVPANFVFEGEIYNQQHERLPAGALVEAYIGNTLCGVATSRSIEDGAFVGYIIAVVGPGSKPGCDPSETITFRVDGRPTLDTKTRPTDHKDPLDLILR